MESDILLDKRKHFEENENDKRTRISGTLLEDALHKRNPDWNKEKVDIYRLLRSVRNVKVCVMVGRRVKSVEEGGRVGPNPRVFSWCETFCLIR